MLTELHAKDLVHTKGRSRLDQALLLLAVGDGAKPVGAIKKVALKVGLRAASKWNISDILRKSDGCAILAESGWELTSGGIRVVAEMANVRVAGAVVKKAIADVRLHLDKISSHSAKDFIEEAIACFENGQLRAAVVFSWVGAVAIMHDYVARGQLPAFNAEARRRNPKWKDARNSDELGRMNEHDFLDVLEAIGSIGKNIKQTLQNQCLNLRNSCGHPTSLQISENSVAAHLDALILNVYSKF